MEITPILNDSGLGSDCRSSGVKRNLHFMYNECTPRGFTRKRKALGRNCSVTDTLGRKLSDVLESSQETLTSNSSYEVSFMASNFKRSSPISAELSWSLQQCTLHTTELLDHQLPKKFKWDDEVFDCSRKSNSEPGTPHRDAIEYPSVTKCRSIELTPVKGSVQRKIGTPERNEILYPQLKEVKPLAKPKSAQRLRDELKRPAAQRRKRLFICRDFVFLFTKVQDHRAVISKIFAYLDESDLAHVARVSPLWRKVLRCDHAAYQRLRLHTRILNSTKENHKNAQYKAVSPVRTRTPPGSPTSENWRKYVKLGLQINPTQSLIKCLSCLRPAVLEQNIAQCSRSQCSYIWCIRCLSGTKLGPGDLHCKCTDLKFTSPSKERCGLSDISNSDSTSFSFFNNSSSTTGNTSSGYFSLSDFEKSNSYYKPIQLRQQQQQQTPISKRKHTVLTDCNKNYIASTAATASSAPSSKGDSFHMVYRQCRNQMPHKRDPIEPGSPPKLNIPAAGSRKSKKNLRRL